VRSGHAAVTTTPVLAAGVGVRHGRSWALRSASFRLESPVSGRTAFGIVISDRSVAHHEAAHHSVAHHEAATALVDVLAGLIRPSYGELRVLGQDMTTARGRSAVRGQVGVARRLARPQPAFRVRGLVDHAARLARLPGRDRGPLAAAIVDRLLLTPWAEVPLRAAPEVIARRARLAAAAVHQPGLLLLDGLLDDLDPRDMVPLADAIRDLGRDTTVVAIGHDPHALALACGEVLTMADGILVRP
jgi:ABC-2 type transport system ATP-binding protein